jgi:hypothetical protein
MNNNDLFVDIYNHLCDKLASDKFIHTFNTPIEVVKHTNKECDYLELSCIDENNLSTSLCSKYKTVKDYVVLFDATNYLENILKSYKYNTEEIWSQFDKDLPRTDVYINKTRINTRSEFTEHLNKIKHIEHKFNNYKFNLLTLCALLCNQSSYALPYILMSKVHASTHDMMISNIPDDRNIKITLDDSLKFKFEASFGVKCIPSGELVNIIKINLELGLCVSRDRAGDYILRNSESAINRYGVITWTSNA